MIGTVPKIREDLIPVDKYRRKGVAMTPTTLTIHNTANEKSTADNERDWLVSDANKVQASWHYCVDQKEAVLAIPEKEVALHSGTTAGNYSSLSIEVCESGDQDVVWKNAVGLTAFILKKYGWGVDKIRKHKDWSGKNCPRKIIPVWDKFIADVQETLNSLKGQGSAAPVTSTLKGAPFVKGKVTADKLNVRKGPATTYDVVKTLAIGTTVTVLGEQDGWFKLDTERWVNKQYIEEVKETATAAPATPSTPAATVPAWKFEGLDYLASKGLVNSPDDWKAKIDEDMPVWAAFTVLANIAKQLGGDK